VNGAVELRKRAAQQNMQNRQRGEDHQQESVCGVLPSHRIARRPVT